EGFDVADAGAVHPAHAKLPPELGGHAVAVVFHPVRPVGPGHHRHDVIVGGQIPSEIVDVALGPPAHLRPPERVHEGDPHRRRVRWRTEPLTMVATSHRSRARAPGSCTTRPGRSAQTGSVCMRWTTQGTISTSQAGLRVATITVSPRAAAIAGGCVFFQNTQR